MKKAHDFHDVNGARAPIVNDQFMNIVKANREFLDSLIDYSIVILILIISVLKHLERAYLI